MKLQVVLECAGGIHLRYGINPDLAVFAKSLANGYAMSAILGNDIVMDAAQNTFISSTNWTERIGPTAAIATIKIYRKRRSNSYYQDWFRNSKNMARKVR